MKHLLLTLALFWVGSISAQTLQQVNANIQLPDHRTAMDGINPFVKSTACGPDTNGYALAKATGLQALNINNATSAAAVAQYFDAPQAITLSGTNFYAWKQDATNGITMNVNVEVYAAAPDSTPTGIPLATATVAVDTVFGTGALDVLKKTAVFTTPITVTNAYVIVVSNPSGTPMSMVFNSWTAAPADGAQEWLLSAQLGPNWVRSYGVNIGGVPLDADGLIEPFTSYDLTASFLVDDPCFSNGLTLNFTNGSSAVTENRMYNVASFQNIALLSYTWDYGDGSPTENLIDASNTYAATGSYTVTLTDTLYGWTTNCVTDTMVLIGPLVASYTSVQTSLTSTFTNTTTPDAGTTYIWDFGDGNTSTLSDPVHTYGVAGTYTVCLTAINNACAPDSVCSTITVTCAAPTPAYTFTSTGLVVDFTNASTAGAGATYLWDLGDGNTSSLSDPSHSYAADGTYTVCLIVSDLCGADSTCQTISVTSCNNPTSNFTISGTSPTFTFTNTSTTTGTTTYTWDFGDGSATSSDVSPTHTYTTNGAFIVSLVVQDSCGTAALDQTVNVTGIGIDELDLASISLYPNPSTGIFHIETSIEMEQAYISDVSGKLIQTTDLFGNEGIIDATQFANGTYFLSIRFADDMIQTIRFEVVK